MFVPRAVWAFPSESGIEASLVAFTDLVGVCTYAIYLHYFITVECGLTTLLVEGRFGMVYLFDSGGSFVRA
jgi:hypothetical protein